MRLALSSTIGRDAFRALFFDGSFVVAEAFP